MDVFVHGVYCDDVKTSLQKGSSSLWHALSMNHTVLPAHNIPTHITTNGMIVDAALRVARREIVIAGTR